MNLRTHSASMVIGFTCSTLAIVFGALSLNFEAPTASAPAPPISSQN